jgi:hypothetical protein
MLVWIACHVLSHGIDPPLPLLASSSGAASATLASLLACALVWSS